MEATKRDVINRRSNTRRATKTKKKMKKHRKLTKVERKISGNVKEKVNFKNNFQKQIFPRPKNEERVETKGNINSIKCKTYIFVANYTEPESYFYLGREILSLLDNTDRK